MKKSCDNCNNSGHYGTCKYCDGGINNVEFQEWVKKITAKRVALIDLGQWDIAVMEDNGAFYLHGNAVTMQMIGSGEKFGTMGDAINHALKFKGRDFNGVYIDNRV